MDPKPKDWLLLEADYRRVTKQLRKVTDQLELAIKQRNNYATLYHSLARVPFQERAQVLNDLDRDLTEPTND